MHSFNKKQKKITLFMLFSCRCHCIIELIFGVGNLELHLIAELKKNLNYISQYAS